MLHLHHRAQVSRRAPQIVATSMAAALTLALCFPATANAAENYPAVAPGQVQYLSDVEWSSITTGYGTARRDFRNWGVQDKNDYPLTIAGTSYEKGVGLHAQASLTVDVNGECQQFLSYVGMDDNATSSGGTYYGKFEVYADASSEPLAQVEKVKGERATLIDVDITGAQTITLKVQQGTNNGGAFADWAEAQLNCSADLISFPVRVYTGEGTDLTELKPGKTGSLVVADAKPGTAIDITLGGQAIGSTMVNDAGETLVNFTVPINAATGSSTLTVNAQRRNGDPESIDLSATIEVPETHVYYVDCDTPTEGDGSEENPLNSIAQVNSIVKLSNGSSILFKRGTTCTGAISLTGSGDTDSPNILSAYGSGDRPIINGDGAQAAIYLRDPSYWTISGLHVKNPGETGVERQGIMIESTTEARKADITITDNVIEDVAGWSDKSGNDSRYRNSAGIMIMADHEKIHPSPGLFTSITITNNRIQDTGGGGIKLQGDGNYSHSKSVYHEEVYIADNIIDSVGGDGIVVHASNAPLVEQNQALNLGQGKYPFKAGNFAGMWSITSKNPLIRYNVVGNSVTSSYDSTAWDCDWGMSAGTCIFEHNYSYGNAGGAYLDCVSGCDSTSTNTKSIVRYNVFQDDCRLAGQSGGPEQTWLYNNVFYCPTKEFVDVMKGPRQFFNNLIVASGGSLRTGEQGEGIEYTTNAYFGGIKPPKSETNPIVDQDPLLFAGGTGTQDLNVDGYRLLNSSPLIGAGTNLDNFTGDDIFGTPTGTTTNVGVDNSSGIEAQPLAWEDARNTTSIAHSSNPRTGAVENDGTIRLGYSADALTQAGLVSGRETQAGEYVFTWDDVPAGTPDSVRAIGQEIAIGKSGNTLVFVGFSTGTSSGGSATIRYTDGTSEPASIKLPNWKEPSGSNASTLATAQTYNKHSAQYLGGSDTVSAVARDNYVHYSSVAVDPDKVVASVTLPSGSPVIGNGLTLFAMDVYTQSNDPVNLVTNYSFEKWESADRPDSWSIWRASGGGTVSRVSGEKSATALNITTDSTTSRLALTQDVVLPANAVNFKLSYWYSLSNIVPKSSSSKAGIRVNTQKPTQTQVSYPGKAESTDGWVQEVTYFSVPEGTETIRLHVFNDELQGTMLIDEIELIALERAQSLSIGTSASGDILTSWSLEPETGEIATYEVHRIESDQVSEEWEPSESTLIRTVPADITSATDHSWEPQEKYLYMVVGKDSAGQEIARTDQAETTAPDTDPLSTDYLSATIIDTQTRFAWRTSTNTALPLSIESDGQQIASDLNHMGEVSVTAETTSFSLVDAEGNTVATASSSGLSHPRVGLTEETLTKIRGQIETEGTPRQAWETVKNRVDAGGYEEMSEPERYGREAAFVYQVTGDTSYAQIAYDAAVTSISKINLNNPKELEVANPVASLALIYDWAYPAWDEDQQQVLRDFFVRSAVYFQLGDHPNLVLSDKASNWVGVVRGAELIQHLVTRGDEEAEWNDERIGQLLDELNRHLESANTDAGWFQEGLDYLDYTAMISTAGIEGSFNVGIDALKDAWYSPATTDLILHSIALTEEPKRLQWGVGTLNDAISFPLYLDRVPDKQLGTYIELLETRRGHRSSTPFYSLGYVTDLFIYWPESIPESQVYDPKSVLPALIDEEAGSYLFRNRIQDMNDVLVGFNSRNHSHLGWSGDDSFGISLISHNTAWATQPGKDQTNTNKYSRIIVDGKAKQTYGNGRTLASTTYEGQGGGYVSFDAAGNLGLQEAGRELVVDMNADEAADTVIAISDTLSDEASHNYDWQLVPDVGVSVEIKDPTDNTQSFVFTKGDSWLYGTLLDVDGAQMTWDEGTRVFSVNRTKTESAQFRILLAVGQGYQPTVVISNGQASIGGKEINFADLASYQPATKAKEFTPALGPIADSLPGQAIDVLGSGFAPQENVNVSVRASTLSRSSIEPIAQVSAITDDEGLLTATLLLPDTMEPGTYQVIAEGDVSSIPAKTTLTISSSNPGDGSETPGGGNTDTEGDGADAGNGETGGQGDSGSASQGSTNSEDKTSATSKESAGIARTGAFGLGIAIAAIVLFACGVSVLSIRRRQERARPTR